MEERKELIYNILKDIEKGIKEPKWNEYLGDKEMFGKTIEIMQEERLIEEGRVIRGGRGNKVELTMLTGVRVTSKGLKYLSDK